VINFSRFPYLRIAIALVIGVFTFQYVDLSSCLLSYSLLLISVLYIAGELTLKVYHNKSFIQGFILLLFVFTAGGWLIKAKNKKLSESMLSAYVDQKVTVYGSITEILKSSGNHKYFAELEYIKTENGEISNEDSKMIVKFSQNDSLASLYKPGDRFLAFAAIKTIPKNTNPEAFDYSAYLKSKDIVFQTFVPPGLHLRDSIDSVSLLKRTVGNTSDYATQTLNQYITDQENNSIAQALLLGQKLLLSEDIYKSYTDTGAIHVLSVSGLHVAIFISLFVWIMSLISTSNSSWKLFKVTILLFIVWFYVVLTGLSPSVVRAGAMVSLYIIGTHFFKGTNSFNLLSIAAICMLIYNPFYLFQVSFQFSFLSLLSILYFQPKIASWWQPSSRVLKFIWDLINVSLAAQILVFPATVFYFHQFPVYFAVSGIVAVPLVTIIIYVGTMLIAFESVFSAVNIALGPILNFLLECLNGSIKFISSWPSSTISGIWISHVELLFLLLFVILLILWLETRNYKVFYSMLLLAFLVLLDNGFRMANRKTQSKMFVYDTFGANLVDIIDGQNIYSIKTGKLPLKSENFAALNNRMKHGVSAVADLTTSDTIGKFWRVGTKTIYINNHDENPKNIRSQNIDILVITKNKYNDPALWSERFHPGHVIIDRNVPEWIDKKWIEAQAKYQFDLHSIKKSGAAIINLK
jgi:competence protein ComEC